MSHEIESKLVIRADAELEAAIAAELSLAPPSGMVTASILEANEVRRGAAHD